MQEGVMAFLWLGKGDGKVTHYDCRQDGSLAWLGCLICVMGAAGGLGLLVWAACWLRSVFAGGLR